MLNAMPNVLDVNVVQSVCEGMIQGNESWNLRKGIGGYTEGLTSSPVNAL